MGGSASINYAVPVTAKVEGESAIYRFPDFKDKLLDRFQDELKTMKDVFINSANVYAQLPALGIAPATQALLSRRTMPLTSSSSPTGKCSSRPSRSAVP